MSILNKILDHKRAEIASRKELYPVKLLEKSIYFESEVVSLEEYLKREDRLGIIAEIKRRSPSEGDINPYIDVEKLSIGYMQAGASALSVLTDSEFFGGTLQDLKTARKFNYCPILRKDFTVDEYQIIEAKSAGADAILLIASALTPKETKHLAGSANSIGLEVLLEVHDSEELATHLNEYVQVVGVNNRNLSTFHVTIDTSLELAMQIPPNMTKISESGISNAQAVSTLVEAGYDGFLIGTHFMIHAEPQMACATLIRESRHLLTKKNPA